MSVKKRPDLEPYMDPRHPLQRYTRKYWLQHVQNTPYRKATRLSEILERFLGTKGPQESSSEYQAWYRHLIGDDGYYDGRYNYIDIEPRKQSIFGICVFGLHKLLTGWWDKDIDVSQVNEDGMDLLAIAASYGHEELCSELISRGSDIHKELGSDYGSAFMEAIGMRETGTAMLLLEKGVNPNQIRKGRSPLCLAVRYAEDLVEPLLKAGANPNVTCPDCQLSCALEAAVYRDKIDSAELLIKYGADVNLMTEGSEYGGSPLGTAAYRGSMECVQLLVENGADVNAHLNGDYGGVLAAAMFGSGGIQMVKYLIEEAGADPAVLSLSPPQSVDSYWRTEWLEAAKYLFEGGHVQQSVLLSIGFPKRKLPETETESDEAESDEAESDEAESDEAESGEAESNKTEPNEAESDETESDEWEIGGNLRLAAKRSQLQRRA